MSKNDSALVLPKIIAVDLDGTLLRSDHTISDHTVKTFRKMENLGCIPVISTGRSYEALSHIKERLGLQSPVICYNGAMICDGRNGKILHEKRLPSDISREVLYTCRDRGIHFQGFSGGQLYYEKKREETDFYEAHTGLRGMTVDFDEWDNLEFTKVLLIGPPERVSQDWPELLQMQQEVKERFGNRIYTAFSRSMYLEMIHGESSKGHALKQLGEDLGARQSEIMAFGDGFNDLEMLQYAGVSVAMDNAPEGLKEQTTHTTVSNDEDGIAVFLEEHFLSH
jgi:Cof subfamily protein (haloacid dehalogenase superfamily)